MTYAYDLLNRIKTAKAYQSAVPSGLEAAYAYDAMSNLMNLSRKNGTGTLIDDLSYHYNYASGHLVNNHLQYVTDTAGSLLGSNLASHSAGNYVYDEIGNLTRDVLFSSRVSARSLSK